MTHFVRFAMIGAMAAGATAYALAQDDIDSLLDGLIDDPAVEQAADPAADLVAAEEPAVDEAVEDSVDELVDDLAADEALDEAADAVADAEPAVEDAVAEAVTEEPADEASVDDLLDGLTDEPVEAVAEVETEEPVEEVAEVETEEPAEEVAEVETEEPVEEVAEVETEEPVEEVAEVETEEPAEEVAEVETEEPAEEVAEVETEEPAEEVASAEPVETDSVADVFVRDMYADEVYGDGYYAATEPSLSAIAAAEEVPVTADDTEAVVEEAEIAADDADEVVEEADIAADDTDEVVEEADIAADDTDEVVEEADIAADDAADADDGAALLADMDDSTEELEAATAQEQSLNDLDMLMQLKNKGLDAHAEACLRKARSLMDPANPPAPGKAFDQYKEAIKMYTDAKKYFREREANLPLKAECDTGIREARYRQAISLFADKDYTKALELAQQVQREGHAYGAQLAAQIQEEMNRPPEIVPEVILPEYAKDEYKAKRVEYLERIRRATVYYHLSKYKEANDQLELVLREDPSNEAAISLRARINRRDAQRKRELKYSTHNEMIAQVEANWTPLGALARNSEELYNPVVTRGDAKKVDDGGQREAETVMAKLQYIRLPEFSIRPPSTLADAVQMFAEMSKAYDKPELPPEEKGVAFVLNMGSDTTASNTSDAEEDPFAMEDSSSSSGGLPPIQNISMPWVTLKEALDMVCEVTGSKYVIKGKTVLVVKDSYVADKMETRSYNVMSSIVEKVTQVNSELSSGGGSDDWSMDSSTDSGSGDTTDMWKKLFTDLGVPFDGKASIVYLSSIGKLRVTNTPENLALFEGILEELNVTPYQIEVEARFVEVSQTDLNSLGFEWHLNSDIVGTVGSGIDWASSAITGNPHGGTAAGGTGAGGYNVFRAGVKGAGGTGTGNVAMHGGSLNQGMRFLGDSSLGANRINLNPTSTGLPVDDTFASFSAVFGKMDMTMILHMLSQRTDTDMLSSPKVLARPGQEAMIRVVTEHIYPTEFDVQELDMGNADDAPPLVFAVEPQSFEKQEIGVSLTVVPEVSQEGQMINLLVNPKVVEYLGDYDYGMDVPLPMGEEEESGSGDDRESNMSITDYQYMHISMPQPKFHFREISTYLSVYNGSTVVMGGLITETRNAFEDKVPILGDLPFIGFLFRSEGEYSEKRNLLIFLTARLVDPAGRPLKTATDGRTGSAAIDSNTATADDVIE